MAVKAPRARVPCPALPDGVHPPPRKHKGACVGLGGEGGFGSGAEPKCWVLAPPTQAHLDIWRDGAVPIRGVQLGGGSRLSTSSSYTLTHGVHI